MKKTTILASIFISLASFTFAQDFGVWEYTRGPHAGMDKISRYIYRKITGLFAPQKAALPWVKTVQQQIYRATPHQGLIGGVVRDYIPRPSVPPFTAQQARVITPAVNKWQQALQQNQPLRLLRVQVVNPQEVSSLSNSEVERVALFLTGKVNMPAEHRAYKHYMVRVTLTQAPAIHLLFNCYLKELYVVRDPAHLPAVTLEEIPSKPF